MRKESFPIRHSLFALRKCLPQFLDRRHLAHKGEGALLLHLPRAAKEGGERQRDSAPPTLMRFTPAADSCSTVKVGSAAPITTLNGFFTAETTVRMARRSRTPGA